MLQHEQVMLLEMLKERIQGETTPILTAFSNSMSPLLRSGDQVGLQELDSSEASLGQIITFINPSDATQLVTHPVAGITGEHEAVKIATFSDRSMFFDSLVAYEYFIHTSKQLEKG